VNPTVQHQLRIEKVKTWQESKQQEDSVRRNERAKRNVYRAKLREEESRSQEVKKEAQQAKEVPDFMKRIFKMADTDQRHGGCRAP